MVTKKNYVMEDDVDDDIEDDDGQRNKTLLGSKVKFMHYLTCFLRM